jgi:hypothetical protein
MVLPDPEVVIACEKAGFLRRLSGFTRWIGIGLKLDFEIVKP